MKFDTWNAIAQRHAKYRELLSAQMAEWPTERIDSCQDSKTLAGVIKLTERVERHQARAQRHLDRGMALLLVPPNVAGLH